MYNINESPITNFSKHLKSKKNSIDLTIGEPYLITPTKIKKATIKALKQNKTKYSSSFGNIQLIDSILEYEKNKNNYLYKRENVIITTGATASIYLSLCTILQENDEVIIPCPFYPDYKQVLDYNKCKMVLLETKKNNYQIDYSELKSKITQKTKCIIINSPNNPTGCIYDKKSIENIYLIIKEFNLFLLLDNCYEQIKINNEINNFSKYPDIKNQIIICQSFSKTYFMTGWRLGYLICNDYLIKKINTLYQTINVCTNTFIQYGGIIAFKINLKKYQKIYNKHLNYAYNKIKKIGLDVYKPLGAIYLFPSIKKINLSSDKFCIELLEKYNVGVMPGICFGADDHVRINFMVKFKKLKKGLKLLYKYIKNR